MQCARKAWLSAIVEVVVPDGRDLVAVMVLEVVVVFVVVVAVVVVAVVCPCDVGGVHGGDNFFPMCFMSVTMTLVAVAVTSTCGDADVDPFWRWHPLSGGCSMSAMAAETSTHIGEAKPGRRCALFVVELLVMVAVAMVMVSIVVVLLAMWWLWLRWLWYGMVHAVAGGDRDGDCGGGCGFGGNGSVVGLGCGSAWCKR